MDPFFAGEITKAQAGWRRVVAAGVAQRHPDARDVERPRVLRRLPHRAASRRTCSRPNATTSGPTPTNGPTSRAASSSTRTGPAAAAPRRARLTTCDSGSLPSRPRLRWMGFTRGRYTTTVKITVRMGCFELDEPLDLPDGTELLVPVPLGAGAWDDLSDEAVAARRNCPSPHPYGCAEALEMTGKEVAEWDACRAGRKRREIADSPERAILLKTLWE